ncbi:hypothetical protein Poli38472_008046 [Pythium oligandrum]|uniref:Apple domain-containing protein n=1 Tax=Pythium oligandrum TaxID=41045 RepID=A0A8K1CLT0_PYTOL|nr:hypothetical protein Poli38472_008046 [Pythium oligandrum]|eukprot:TMW65404.1 hypothetical protein Poli38472_008046 [Pythium oligandrum]
MPVCLPVLLVASLSVLLAPAQANSLRSIADIERRLAKMEYMAAMSPPLSCFVENGFNYKCSDISSRPNSPTPDDCCSTCFSTSGCGAFSWSADNGGTCWLKRDRGEIVVDSNFKSSLFRIVVKNPVCVLKADVDYTGNDIGRVSASKPEDCCDKCHNYAGCRAYTWTDKDGGTWWLKSKSGSETYKPGASSAEAYPVSGSDTCKTEYDVEIVGSDIGTVPGPGGDCCNICKMTNYCVAFSWTNENGGTCYLKGRVDKTVNKPAPTCTLETDVDYIGNDIATKPSPNAGGCCDICKTAQGCATFSWTNQNGGTCWLKSSKGSRVQKAGVTSSSIFGPGPLPPNCSLEKDIDYVGNDIGSKASTTAGGCCDIRKATQGCGAFSWTNQNGGTCWLKSSKGSTTQKSRVISALVVVVPPTPTCGLKDGIDYVGNDIGNKPSPTADGCCGICKTTQRCVAFSWTNQNGGTCWLKNGKGQIVQKPGVISSWSSSSPIPMCTLETDVDYVGNDIGSKKGSTAGACCDICKSTQACVAFSWTNQDGGTCWLKSRKDQTIQKAGVTSSQVLDYPPLPDCKLESDIDYVGNDVGNVASSDPGQCCTICKAHSNCKAFTWSNYQGGTCWLKSAKTGTTNNPGVKSGVV